MIFIILQNPYSFIKQRQNLMKYYIPIFKFAHFQIDQCTSCINFLNIGEITISTTPATSA